MRLKHWGLFAAFGLLAGASAEAGATDSAAAGLEALRARCPTTRNLGSAVFVDGRTPSAAELDQWQQRIRGDARTDGPPPGAEVVLRAFAGGSMTQSERSETATTVWRLPDGSWHFVASDHYPNRMVRPPPPPARLTEAQVEAARRSLSGGVLDPTQAAALDTLLADPCLEVEPSVVTGPLPLRLDLPAESRCFDAVGQVVELVRSGRRRVYVQTCLRFLAGELIQIALYPRLAGSAPAAMPASNALASLESARLYADEVLRAAFGGEAWINVTEAAGGYAFVHRPSGFRCAATQVAEIQVFGPSPNQPAGDGGRCVRNSSLPVRGGAVRTEWEVARRAAGSVPTQVRDAADSWFTSYHGGGSQPRILMRSVRREGIRMARAEVAGAPYVDAREDELTIVLGAEHDGWVVVAKATGSASDPAAVEAAALGEWRNVIATRVAPPG